MPNNLILVGTAHVLEQSIRDVEEIIEREKPEIVAVELDEKRYRALVEENYDDISIKDILKSGEIYLLLFQWILAFLQRKIGDELGVKPGAEMLRAVEKGKEVGAQIVLIDRDITITFRRFWSKMKFLEKIKMMFSLIKALTIGGKEEIEIDKIIEDDMVSHLVKEFRKFSPEGAKVLVDERDAFIAANLLRLTSLGKKIVAVVGAGHQEGIKKYMDNPALIPPMHDLLSVPKKQINLPKLIGFGMVAVLILLFASIFLSLSTEIILSALFYWFIINGFLAALGAALARGHILSIIAAFLSAWLTSLNPFIGAGWVAGLVEVWKREPSSKDLRELSRITNFKELMENRLFRVVLVAAFTNLGSMVGTFLGAYVIFRLYGVDIVSSLRPVFGGLL